MNAALFIPWFKWSAWQLSLPFLADGITVYPFALLGWIGLMVALGFAVRNGRSVSQTLDLTFYLVLFSFPISYVLNIVWYQPAEFHKLDRAHLKLSLRDAGFGVGRKAGTRRNSKAISRASNTASGFEDKSQQISLR